MLCRAGSLIAKKKFKMKFMYAMGNGMRSVIIFSLLVGFVACEKETVITPVPQVLTTGVKSELSAIADRVFQNTSTPGLIALISVEGEADFYIKRGVSNIVTNDPIHENNAFRIASVTKTFTGTAILMLADEGLISLDHAISDYLPEYNIPSGDSITIRMLGNMTSGLYNYSDSPELWEPFIASGYTLSFPPDSLLAIAFRHPLKFTPGTAYDYCNTNTILLGLLLEKVSNMPAAQFIQEKICRPLNLKQTCFGGPFFMQTPYTHGYALTEEGMADATNWNPSWGWTAGALVSDLKDMKQWGRLLADGALLSQAMKNERFNFGADGYGFGVESIHYKNDLWVGHPGSIPGYNTQVWHNAARKTTLVIYANSDELFPAQTLLIEFVLFFGKLAV